jgi:glycopeptide antibiotics resistance protein
MMAFLRSTDRSFFLGLFLTIAAGFLISLFIEYSQSWMVARSSSTRDLILNTSGTFFGVLLYPLCMKSLHFFCRKF